MPLDPSIIGSFRPPEVMSPVNAMAQMYQLRALQGESEKNQLAMEKSRRDMAREDTLRNLLVGAKGDTGSAVNALRGGGFYTEAEGIEKSASELRTKELEQAKARNDIFDQKMRQYRSAIDMVGTPEEMLNVHNAVHKDEFLGPMLASYGISPDTGTKQITATIGNPDAFNLLKQQMALSSEKFHELNKGVPITRNLGATTETILVNPLTGDHRVLNVSKNTASPENRPLVKVNIDSQANAEKKARGEMLVDDYKEVAKIARGSQKLLVTLDTQQKVLDEGFKTGFGSGAKKAAASLLGALGVREAEKYATDSQKFLSAAQQVVLQRTQEQKGPQTEGDRQVIEETVARLANTVEANKFIIAVARAVAKRDIEERQFYDNWYKKKETYDGAADAWLAGEGSKSIFDRPELAKYKKSAPAASGGSSAPAEDPNRPLTAEELAEYNRLKSRKR